MRAGMIAVIASCLFLPFFVVFGQEDEAPSVFPGSTIEVINPAKFDGSKFVVTMSNQPPFYSPKELKISVGDMVIWKNQENSDTHTAVSLQGTFSSIDIPASREWGFRFLAEGEFSYGCRYHPWMTGKIIVSRKAVQLSAIDFFDDFAPTDFRVGQRGTLWVLGSQNQTPYVYRRDAGETQWRQVSVPMAESPLRGFWANDAEAWLLIGDQNLLHFPKQANKWDKYELPPLGNKMVVPVEDFMIWLVDPNGHEVSRWSAENGKLETSSLQIENGEVRAIAACDKEKIWLLNSGNVVFCFNANTSKTDRIDLPRGANVSLMTAISEALWYVDAGRNKIGKIRNGWITEHSINHPLQSLNSLIVNEDRVWLTSSDGIGYFDNGRVFQLALPKETTAGVLRGDSKNNLWMLNGNTLCQVILADNRH